MSHSKPVRIIGNIVIVIVGLGIPVALTMMLAPRDDQHPLRSILGYDMSIAAVLVTAIFVRSRLVNRTPATLIVLGYIATIVIGLAVAFTRAHAALSALHALQ